MWLHFMPVRPKKAHSSICLNPRSRSHQQVNDIACDGFEKVACSSEIDFKMSNDRLNSHSFATTLSLSIFLIASLVKPSRS